MNREVDVRNIAIFKRLEFTAKHLVHYEHHYHYDNDFLQAFSHWDPAFPKDQIDGSFFTNPLLAQTPSTVHCTTCYKHMMHSLRGLITSSFSSFKTNVMNYL